MWHDMASVRSVVEKVAVLEEYRDSELLSVISVLVPATARPHVSRVPCTRSCSRASIYDGADPSHAADGTTCMSQAFEAGLSLVRPGEPTVLTFHSDGYANDSSPTEEKRKIEQLLDTAKKQELDLAIDTVAYSDFPTSGCCSDLRQDGWSVRRCSRRQGRSTGCSRPRSALPRGRPRPSPLIWLVMTTCSLVSRSASKICLSEKGKDLVVRGLKPGDDATIYKLREDASAQGLVDAEPQAYYALSAALWREGRSAPPREVLCSTRDHVFQMHWRALSRADIEAFYADVVASLWRSGEPADDEDLRRVWSGPALVDLFSAMAEHARTSTSIWTPSPRVPSAVRPGGSPGLVTSGALIQPR